MITRIHFPNLVSNIYPESMTLKLSVTSNLDELTKYFTELEKGQVPFAASRAINAVAKIAQGDLRAEMGKVFDRPKPFTMNSLYVKNSNKRNLTATVGHKDQASNGTPAAEYLQSEISGGERKQTPFERIFGVFGNGALVPTGAKRDRFGGVAKAERLGAIKGSEGNGNGYFVIKPGDSSHLKPGIYQRKSVRTRTRNSGLAGGKVAIGGGSTIRPIMLYKPTTTYRPIYNMVGVVQNTINREFTSAFTNAMDQAMATAKR